MKEAYYFPHDANARTDARILELRAELGWEGYGLWWALVEHLREASEYRLNNTLIGGLAMDLAIPKPELRTLLDLCISLGLLAVEGDFFFSPSLRRRMKSLDDKREARANASKQAADIRWQKQRNASAMPAHTERIAVAMQNDATIENSREQDKRGEGKDVGQSACQSVRKLPPPPDDVQLFSAESWPSLASPEKFAALCINLDFPQVDFERYRKQIIVGIGELQLPATSLRNWIKSYLNNDKDAGKLLLPVVQTPNEIPSNWHGSGPYVPQPGGTIPNMSDLINPNWKPAP